MSKCLKKILIKGVIAVIIILLITAVSTSILPHFVNDAAMNQFSNDPADFTIWMLVSNIQNYIHVAIPMIALAFVISVWKDIYKEYKEYKNKNEDC